MAEALQALLASLCSGSVHVVGYSLGARVALELCARTGQPASLAFALQSFPLFHAMFHDELRGTAILLVPVRQTQIGTEVEHCVICVMFLKAQGSLYWHPGCCARPAATVHAGYDAASLTLVSGTAGLTDMQQRQARREKDEGLAAALLAQGLPAFVRAWYQQPMWQSLRSHARCTHILNY